MKRTVVVFVAGCMFLSACGTNGAAEGPTAAAGPEQITANPVGVQPTNQPADVPAPVQEPAMDASEPTRENPAPAAPTPIAAQAQPQPAATPTAQATIAAPLDPAMARLVAGARADLAKRRGVALDMIEVAEARSVTWPDPSLGCPQPGMAYRQVPVDGVLIRLRVGGTIFNYHGGGSRAPFLCEHPAP